MYFLYPLMTTAECPNLLTSLWRFGFGNIFHSSQARIKEIKKQTKEKWNKKQIKTNTTITGQINDITPKVKKPLIHFSWPII